jgi:hypothetical protein
MAFCNPCRKLRQRGEPGSPLAPNSPTCPFVGRAACTSLVVAAGRRLLTGRLAFGRARDDRVRRVDADAARERAGDLRVRDRREPIAGSGGDDRRRHAVRALALEVRHRTPCTSSCRRNTPLQPSRGYADPTSSRRWTRSAGGIHLRARWWVKGGEKHRDEKHWPGRSGEARQSSIGAG